VAERFLAEGIEEHLGERLRSARPMGGGCIGEVYRVELADGTTLAAKVDREGASHLDREAYMLRYLREKSELPVPEVHHGSNTLLLMEFIDGSRLGSWPDLAGAERHAAELLGALHDITARAYGHERDTLVGSLDQPNPWTKSWTEFFREQRLLYLAGVAHAAGRLPTQDLKRIERLAERLDEYLGEARTARCDPRRRVERQRVGARRSHSGLPRPGDLPRRPRDRALLYKPLRYLRRALFRALR
jgi:fructosamine-3-kinase